MILKGSLTPQQQEYLHTITRSGKHLLTLINHLLEMSKVEADPTTINLTNFSNQKNLVNSSGDQSSMSLEEMTECMAQMPVEWVEQLHQAATQVNGKQIKQLCAQIAEDNILLTNKIIELVDNFCFEEIVRSTLPRV